MSDANNAIARGRQMLNTHRDATKLSDRGISIPTGGKDEMNPISSLLIAGLVLSGIGSGAFAQPQHQPPTVPPVPCNAGICNIEVKVNTCGAKDGISVQPQFLSMAASGSSTIIHWKIVTPGHVFAPNGIVFDPATSQFHRLPGTPPNEIRMRNDKSTQGNFYYYVDVQDCVRVDPWIQNN